MADCMVEVYSNPSKPMDIFIAKLIAPKNIKPLQKRRCALVPGMTKGLDTISGETTGLPPFWKGFTSLLKTVYLPSENGLPPFWKGVYSKRKGICPPPLGANSLLRVDPFSEEAEQIFFCRADPFTKKGNDFFSF